MLPIHWISQFFDWYIQERGVERDLVFFYFGGRYTHHEHRQFGYYCVLRLISAPEILSFDPYRPSFSPLFRKPKNILCH